MNDGIMNDEEAEEYIQELTKAAENEENSAILNMTTEKINEIRQIYYPIAYFFVLKILERS